MGVYHLYLIFTPVSSPDLLAIAIAQILGLVIEHKANNASIHLVAIAKAIADIDKLLNHNKALTQGNLRR
jgi:hypothetical protein